MRRASRCCPIPAQVMFLIIAQRKTTFSLLFRVIWAFYGQIVLCSRDHNVVLNIDLHGVTTLTPGKAERILSVGHDWVVLVEVFLQEIVITLDSTVANSLLTGEDFKERAPTVCLWALSVDLLHFRLVMSRGVYGWLFSMDVSGGSMLARCVCISLSHDQVVVKGKAWHFLNEAFDSSYSCLCFLFEQLSVLLSLLCKLFSSIVWLRKVLL